MNEGASLHPANSVRSVLQGEFAVSADPAAILTTVLGSCVAACLHDPVLRLGGMNHFLLPETGSDDTRARLYGAHLMELLINDLLALGARRERLVAKLFGGARVVPRLSGVGEANITFARRFFADEGIRLVAESVGGRRGLHLRFRPTTGRAHARRIAALDTIQPPRAPELKERNRGEVELF